MRILLADDHGLYRKGLQLALAAALPQVTVIEADGMDAVLALLDDNDGIDLALIDLNMNGMISLAVLKEIRQSYPKMRVIIISASRNRCDILEALGIGLHGFICKNQSEDEIVSAVADVISGRIYVPPVLAAWGPELDQNGLSNGSFEEKTALSRRIDFRKLTPRQRDVLKLIAEGLSNKGIARQLSIAEATTKIHVAALMRALGVRNRTEAALKVKAWLDEQEPTTEMAGQRN